MVARTGRRPAGTSAAMKGKRFLIIEARFYEDIAEELAAGAMAAISGAGGTYERIAVPGALEIPTAVRLAMKKRGRKFDGFVALGCVIRGETYHFEVVCNESARGLQDLALAHGLAIGNGILTVDSENQAHARSRPSEGDKGGDAARAAMALVSLRTKFGAR